MRPEQFYQEIGGSYQEALTRMPDDRRIIRYLDMFLQDPSMEELGKALTAGDTEEAFSRAHALKGTCLTLGLGRLTVRVSELTEMLRAGWMEGARRDYADLERTYQEVCEKIRSVHI